ncbi:threonine ammonia-lyase [Candidatus Palauibacter sp.]|uniref:threonine ammonia-lyase n=1 Tax=Candidatus Palauibacter sp. TaxID=3101350 RepID=UPI003AF2738F
MKPPGLPDIEAARERVYAAALRSPLVRLGVDEGPEIWLKLENLQPIGSFKIRGSANAIGLIPPEELAAGVWTASAGNMAQGVAWNARRLGVPCSVVVPETAPRLKLDAIARLGATAVKTSVASWFEVFRTQRFEGMRGRFVHAFMDRDVMAGNGTIALELIEDLPDVNAVIVPFGGGGLACGIAAGMRALAPDVPVFASEVTGQAPFAESLRAGRAVSIPYTPSFVDGIGGPHVEPAMWELSRDLLAGSVEVSLSEAASAIRLLATRNRVVAEGAAAAGVAAGLSGAVKGEKIACIVSGGNLDPSSLSTILDDGVPRIRSRRDA